VSGDRRRGLTRDEFDRVIRRAAELATSEADAGERALTEGELLRIAGEVGLGEAHVRQALGELRAGRMERGPVARIFGPGVVSSSRVVPGTPRELAVKCDDFFVASQLLQAVRRGSDRLQYRPSVDWASQLARAASFTSRKYYVASAQSVEVHLDAVDDEHTLVELHVDPGTRSEYLWGAGLGGAAAGAGLGVVGATILVAAASMPPLGAALLGGVAGTGLWGGITWSAGQAHKRKMLEVRAEVEGILDRLEVGASLEPPPPAWRRWVKRQFHGVARDLTSSERELDDDLRREGREPNDHPT
jgi:hypothetical protein